MALVGDGLVPSRYGGTGGFGAGDHKGRPYGWHPGRSVVVDRGADAGRTTIVGDGLVPSRCGGTGVFGAGDHKGRPYGWHPGRSVVVDRGADAGRTTIVGDGLVPSRCGEPVCSARATTRVAPTSGIPGARWWWTGVRDHNAPVRARGRPNEWKTSSLHGTSSGSDGVRGLY